MMMGRAKVAILRGLDPALAFLIVTGGAAYRIRTDDLPLTSPMISQFRRVDCHSIIHLFCCKSMS